MKLLGGGNGGNSSIFIFIPILGEDEPILTCAYFWNVLAQPPTRIFLTANQPSPAGRVSGQIGNQELPASAGNVGNVEG